MSSFQSDCPFRQGFYAFYTRLRVPKLYRYVYEGRWHKIPRRTQTHPHEAKFRHRYAPRNTALHCLLCAPDSCSTEYKQFLETTNAAMQQEIAHLRLKAVRALVEVNPSIVSTPDCLGRTPLHLACINIEYCEGAAEILLDACPMAGCIQDCSGKTPLHYLLLAENQEVPPRLIQKFAFAAPNAVNIKDRRGRSPLDIVRLNHSQQSKSALILKMLSEYDTATNQPVYLDIRL